MPSVTTLSFSEATPPDYIEIDVRDLVDGATDPNLIVPKLKRGVSLLKQGSNVAVRCVMGVSRSSAVLAGILVLSGVDATLEDSLNKLRLVQPRINPNAGILDSVGQAVGLVLAGI